MNDVKFVLRTAGAWVLLYLLGAFVSADWDSYYWHEYIRVVLALAAFAFAFALYGTRNLED